MHIYQITNTVNGKLYIGQHNGQNLQRYLNDQFRLAKKSQKGKPALYGAIRKYGESAFVIQSIVRPVDGDQMNSLERFFIRTLETQKKDIGYNIVAGGGVGSHGIKFSDEHRKKIGDALRGRICSDEHRRKIGESKKNLSPQARENISKAQRGKKASPEHLAKLHAGFTAMSTESRQRMNTGYLKKENKPRTPEHSKKISDALRGRKASAETKKKLSAIRRGRKLSLSHRKSISEAFRKRLSPEQRSELAKLANEIRWHKHKTNGTSPDPSRSQ